jgi:hypothetical protein
MTKRSRWLSIPAAALVVVVAGGVLALAIGMRPSPPPPGATVGEKLDALKAERAALQARADGLARVELLEPLRVASLLSDALAVRAENEGERVVGRMPGPWRQGFAELESVNMSLRDALARPGPGATIASRAVGRRAEGALERLANNGGEPVVLSFTPRFVPPRRTTGELTLAPRTSVRLPRERDVPIRGPPDKDQATNAPTVPRYAPDFAMSSEKDAPVSVEIVGLNLGSKGETRVLTVGGWHGEGQGSGERLAFSVPRGAFSTATVRTTLVPASLAIRRDGRTVTFDLPFVVLPDRPGSMAFDQRVRATVLESKTLVSPEILARAGVGETRTVHRCFDPPEGWRFDKTDSHVVVVERLAWVDDVSDQTMNAGSVEFSSSDSPEQICVDVVARPAAKTARTATIGRFEATLVRDREEDRTVKSGVRALDWREPVRVPLESNVVEWKLYVRLFDEIDRDFIREVADLPFLHIAFEGGGGEGGAKKAGGGKTLVITADPSAEPRP